MTPPVLRRTVLKTAVLVSRSTPPLRTNSGRVASVARSTVYAKLEARRVVPVQLDKSALSVSVPPPLFSRLMLLVLPMGPVPV